MLLKIKKLRDDVKLPVRKEDSIGYDLYALDDYILAPGDVQKLPLGFTTEFDLSLGAFIWDRSSLGLIGITKCAGCIEGTYRGEWAVVLANVSKHAYHIKKGDRIAQVVFANVVFPEIEEVKELKESKRKGGFGSTGK